jgi:hypothetical protein
VDAFFNSVFQMLLIYCIMTGKDWIRVPYFYYHAFHLCEPCAPLLVGPLHA